MKRRSSVAFGFLGLIAIGAVLLASPWARAAGTWGDPMTALFTACSAVCVTGLTVIDPAAEFSFAGQCVLLSLVEIGCLGLMTCGTFLMIAIGRKLSLMREFSLMNAYGVAQVQGLKGLICWIIGSMLTIEAIGAIILGCHFGDAYQGVFFSVMSFCNAGFSLYPDSLARYASDPLVLLTLAAETILGGIGFLVIYNLFTFKFLRFRGGGARRLSLNTRVTLRVSAILLAVTFAAFLAIEWNAGLKGLSTAGKLLVGFYQSVTPRTCGFCVIPTESLQPLTQLVYEVLMFIGGAPGSAAAGMKVTTFAVLLYTLTAMCRNERETVIDRRVVPYDTVRESLVIFMAMIAFIAFVTGVLLVTEASRGLSTEALFFEAVSAVTTTGLAFGETTAELSFPGKIVVMVAMFFGRLGALTVVMMIGDRESNSHIRFPTEELVVG